MKNSKCKRRVHIDDTEYVYIEDYHIGTMRVYQADGKQIWFELPTNCKPAEVKIEIIKRLRTNTLKSKNNGKASS